LLDRSILSDLQAMRDEESPSRADASLAAARTIQLPGPAEIDKSKSALFKVSTKREDVYFMQ
jgi:hypothetical protein